MITFKYIAFFHFKEKYDRVFDRIRYHFMLQSNISGVYFHIYIYIYTKIKINSNDDLPSENDQIYTI